METAPVKEWYLRKHEDGSIFGPLTFDQLTRWASAAQIAPHDALSSDQKTWIKAPMVPQLGMDWLVELTSERYYGPTTLGAIQEFIRLGEINAETYIINSCDGTRKQTAELPALLQPEKAESDATSTESTAAPAPAAMRMAIDVNDRIRELEQSLREERRALRESEARYRELEKKYQELAQTAR
jgi:histone deacetylase complex regulatory component SIN3